MTSIAAGVMVRPEKNITLRPFTAGASWRYGDELSMYDGRPEDAEEPLVSTPDGYGATLADGELLGYCCFGPDGRVPGQPQPRADLLDLGGDLRPDLVGQGLGAVGLPLVLTYTRERFSPRGSVSPWPRSNRRAINVCRWVGFRRMRSSWAPGARVH